MADPRVRELYQRIEDQGGRVINLFKVMGHCPYIGLNFQRLGNSILHGEVLAPNLRELVILRVGDLTGANYEFTKHVPRALRAGVRQDQIDAIGAWACSEYFDERECAMLRYTDAVTQDVEVKDETFASLRRFFDDHEIVELTAIIGYYCMVCRILVALQVELEEEES